MPRIDAALATQVGDTTRPLQSQRESQSQQAEVRRADEQRSDPATPAGADELKAIAQRLQTVIEVASGRQLNFDLNDRFREVVVTISDRKSGEVLKEIPSKELLQLRERLNDIIGLFVDEKA
jgi:flagellar protein FlaG